MSTLESQQQAAEAFTRGEWPAALEAWTRVGFDRLSPDELDHCATAAELLGRHETSIRALQQAFLHHHEQGDIARAVYCAFRLAMITAEHGQQALSGGLDGSCRNPV